MKTIRLELTQEQFARLYKESGEASTLRKILDKKIDDMIKRELYTDFLKAETDAEKEKARQIYLNKITRSI